MARVIYLPGGGLRLEFEQPLEAEALARQVESGAWQPPAGCPAPAGPLRAHVCGGWLVVTAEPAPAGQTGHCAWQPAAGAGARPVQLSRRQAEVLSGLAEGLTTGRLALELGISTKTVQHHIGSLHRLLGSQTRAQLIRRAATMGLLGNEGP